MSTSVHIHVDDYQCVHLKTREKLEYFVFNVIYFKVLIRNISCRLLYTHARARAIEVQEIHVYQL